MAIRVLIADDHEVVRSGLKSLFEDTDIEVVGEAATGPEAIAKTRECRPDVVLMDIRMPEADGLAALEEIHAELPDTRIVVLSTYDNPTYIARAVALGADDYLLKGMNRDELLDAIRAVATGAPNRGSALLRQVAGAMGTRSVAEDPDVALTQRETQVLRHLALGLSNKEIGRSLSISIETVKEHVQNVLRKINCTDRTQAAVWAVRKELV
jgi:DNA-binding NarL/FixJ family response regulator